MIIHLKKYSIGTNQIITTCNLDNGNTLVY